MAKKKMSFGLGSIVAVVATLLGIAAFIMLFVPQLNYQSATGLVKGDSLNGLKITFGYSDTVFNEKVKVLNFSIGNFLTYLLLLVGIIFAVLAFLGKLGKFSALVSAVAFIVAGVFFFLALTFVSVYVGDATGDVADKAVETFKSFYKLGAGAIVGGILSLLAGLAMAAKLFIKK